MRGLPILVLAALAPAAAASADISGTVDAVTTGNMFSIGAQQVRLFGVDAPDLRQLCRADAIYEPGPSPCVPCGEHARQALAALILGKAVVCTERGREGGMILGECRAGKIEVNLFMLSSGRAVSDKLSLTARDHAYVAAEASAKRAGMGLWSETFIPPSSWRSGTRLACEKQAP